MGLLIRERLTILKPAMEPNMPVQTTTAAVSAGMPPSDCEISMAMGVVTAFGASERATSRVAPSISAMTMTETSPATQPASSAMSSGMTCLRMVESWR